MSVVGLDVGNENCIVAVARQRGIDVVLNDESKRETPALVSFNAKQRFIGTAASASLTMTPKNTVAQIKRLLGRKFSDPEVQHDLCLLPFKITEGPDGCPHIHVLYLGETRTFIPSQILGIILSNLRGIAEKNLQTHVADCVIGIPVFFTELQRRAMLDAATIAGLRPLRLMHETSATALAYGIYKTDLPENDPINVVFVDVGHAATQVCVAAFRKGQLKVLAQGFDRSLGGRDFDEILFLYFCGKFKEEYKMDVLSNSRACQRLRSACEKTKKVLSANPEATLSVECLMDEKDVKGFMKRDDFEKLARALPERVKTVCENALCEADISTDKLYAVEVVGSGSRVPAILKVLSSVFKKEPSRTMNASECIARGCALQCAMLSPTFRVRDFEVQDAFPFSICFAWKGADPELEEGEHAGESLCSSVVFPKGNPVPSTKMLTFYRSETFQIDALYEDMQGLPAGTSQKITTFTIGPFKPTEAEKAKVKVKIRLNLHGVVSVDSATMIEEEEVEVSVSNPDAAPAAMEVDANQCPKVPDLNDPSMDTSDHSNLTGMHNGQAPAEENKTEVLKKKKKSKRKEIPVKEVPVGAFARSDLQKAVEQEYEMALQDRVMEDTKDKKNAVEAYVYDMRNKMSEKYQEYATDAEREDVAAQLQQTEDWLDEEGEDETKGVYVAKLAELKKLGDPIEGRFKEEEARGPCVDLLLYCIDSFREAAISKDPKFDHIESAEKEKVVLECNAVEEWLSDRRSQQECLSRAANPVLLSADIKKKMEALDRFCKPIMTKPQPPPPKPTSPPSKGPSSNESEGTANGTTSVNGEPQDEECVDADSANLADERMQTA